MTDQNVCPYCGGEVRTTCEYRTKWGNWRATVACDAGHSINFRMQMSGNASIPTVSARAIDAFCHPAHLLADLHIYDPSTHVVVSRDRLARHIETLDSLPVTTLAVTQIAAEIRAALEVQK